MYFISHADVLIDPDIPVPEWGLSAIGKSRHHRFNEIALRLGITEIYSSDEQKSIDAADILSGGLGIEFQIVPQLHENDRSSTGYLQSLEFEKTADEFFQHPNESIRGWESAADAQCRIVSAIVTILKHSDADGNIAVLSHGGVGALLMCKLLNIPITRKMDQPGSGGGHYFTFNAQSWSLIHGWKDISSPPRESNGEHHE
ncbi:MAG: histidine phosphatase family protein [Granulosicoccus sp.]|nr:histidine phosphatase family protein [Granulosicoccus sp.]